MAFSVLIDGTPYRFRKITIDEILSSDPSICTVMIPKLLTFGDNPSVVIKEDGTTIWQGLMDYDEPLHSKEGSQVRISARDHLVYLFDRVVGEGDDENNPSTLVTNLLSDLSISAGTINNYSSTVTVRKDRQTRWEYLRDLAERINWEYRLNIDDTLDFKETVGTDKSSSVTLTIGDNARRLRWKRDRQSIRNRLYAIGKGTNEDDRIVLPDPYFVQDQNSIDTYRLKEDVVIAKHIINSGDLLTHTNSVLARLKDPKYTYRVKVIDDYNPNTLLLGDTINLVDSNLSIDGNFRIFEKHLVYQPIEKGGGKDLELVLSNRLPRLEIILDNKDTNVTTHPQTVGSGTGWNRLMEYIGYVDFNSTAHPQRDGTEDPELFLIGGTADDENAPYYMCLKETSSITSEGGTPAYNSFSYNLDCVTRNEGTYWYTDRLVTWGSEGDAITGSWSLPYPLCNDYRAMSAQIGSSNHLYWLGDSSDALTRAIYILDLGSLENLNSFDGNSVTTEMNLDTQFDFTFSAEIEGFVVVGTDVYAFVDSHGSDHRYYICAADGTYKAIDYLPTYACSFGSEILAYEGVGPERWIIIDPSEDFHKDVIMHDEGFAYGHEGTLKDGRIQYDFRNKRVIYNAMESNSKGINPYRMHLWQVNIP